MDQAPHGGGFAAFVPLIIMSLFITIVAYLFGREKGHNAALWTIPGLIPMVNFFALALFVGAANWRLEQNGI